MKELARLLGNLSRRNKKDVISESRSIDQSAAVMKPETVLTSQKAAKVNVTDAMAVTLHGLPLAMESQDIQALTASILAAVMKNASQKTYDRGDTIVEGEAMVDFDSHDYPVAFTIQASRLLAAIAAYKQGYDQAKIGGDIGIYDQELAEMAAAHFKSSAWHEVEKFVHQFDVTKVNAQVTQITLEESKEL